MIKKNADLLPRILEYKCGLGKNEDIKLRFVCEQHLKMKNINGTQLQKNIKLQDVTL